MNPMQLVHNEIRRFQAEQNFGDFFWQIVQSQDTARIDEPPVPILVIEAMGRPRETLNLSAGDTATLRSFLYRYFGLREPNPDLVKQIWADIPGPRVMVCLPQRDSIKSSNAMSLVNMTMATQGKLPFLYAHQRASNIAFVRNMLTQTAIDAGADRILFIDDDMVFPPNAMLRLAAHDVDIVGACYVKRAPPHICLGHALSGASTFIGPGLEPMRRMPTGLLMIKTEVFRKVPRPWFSEVQFPWIDMQSDDYYFSDHAFEAGFKLFCDKDLTWETGHIGEQVFAMYRPGAEPVKAPAWSAPSAAVAAD